MCMWQINLFCLVFGQNIEIFFGDIFTLNETKTSNPIFSLMIASSRALEVYNALSESCASPGSLEKRRPGGLHFSDISRCFDASLNLRPMRHKERWWDYWCNVSEALQGMRALPDAQIREKLLNRNHEFSCVLPLKSDNSGWDWGLNSFFSSIPLLIHLYPEPQHHYVLFCCVTVSQVIWP